MNNHYLSNLTQDINELIKLAKQNKSNFTKEQISQINQYVNKLSKPKQPRIETLSDLKKQIKYEMSNLRHIYLSKEKEYKLEIVHLYQNIKKLNEQIYYAKKKEQGDAFKSKKSPTSVNINALVERISGNNKTKTIPRIKKDQKITPWR